MIDLVSSHSGYIAYLLGLQDSGSFHPGSYTEELLRMGTGHMRVFGLEQDTGLHHGVVAWDD